MPHLQVYTKSNILSGAHKWVLSQQSILCWKL